MLVNDIHDKLFNEWSESIIDDEVRAAFWYLVGLSACLNSHECRIQRKGEIRDFRFYERGGEQPFSFITNQQWLLFYFQPPAIRSGRYSKERLLELFDSFKENPDGEWTVKIRSVGDADCVAKYLGWVKS